MVVDFGRLGQFCLCYYLHGSFLPVFYKTVSAQGVPNVLSTVYWAYANFIAALIVAFSFPVLGAIADTSSVRKKFFFLFTLIGVISTFFISFTGKGDYVWVAILYIFGTIGFAGSEVFYNSFLPLLSSPEKRDRLSSYGFALGYLGGGILLAIDITFILAPSKFGFSSTLSATKISFVTVSLWWFVFVLPFVFTVEDKAFISGNIVSVKNKLKKFLEIFYEVIKEPNVFKFLIAFWLYNDGVVTIVKMATAYGVEIGIQPKDLIIAILLTQFVGIPFTILFGNITRRIKTKYAILIALLVYMGITFWGIYEVCH